MDLTDMIMTIVASTSAIVAIVGGFLISRVISLHSGKKRDLSELSFVEQEIDAREIKLQEITGGTGSPFEFHSTRTDLTHLRYRRDFLHDEINQNERGVLYGVLVLLYASVASILIPVFLLPYPLNFYNDANTRILLLTLFCSSLLAIFIYFFWQLSALANVGKEEKKTSK